MKHRELDYIKYDCRLFPNNAGSTYTKAIKAPEGSVFAVLRSAEQLDRMTTVNRGFLVPVVVISKDDTVPPATGATLHELALAVADLAPEAKLEVYRYYRHAQLAAKHARTAKIALYPDVKTLDSYRLRQTLSPLKHTT